MVQDHSIDIGEKIGGRMSKGKWVNVPLQYINVCGIKAHTLIDTGCTINMISLLFLVATDEVPFKLHKFVGLLLATVGSKSKVNHGYRAKLQFGI
jgi:hypothetical protein